LIAGAKVLLFSEPPKLFAIFFQKKFEAEKKEAKSLRNKRKVCIFASEIKKKTKR